MKISTHFATRSGYSSLVAASFVAAGMAGCAFAAEDETAGDQIVSTDEGITGGTLVTSSQNTTSPYSSVVAFTPFPDDFANCTATKISQGTSVDTYVTAAHCVPGVVVNSPIYLNNGLEFDPNVAEKRIRSIYQHPSCLNDVDAGTLCLHASVKSYDVAVFTIDRNTSIPALPGNPDIGTTRFERPSQGRMIGYGCDAANSKHDGFKQTALVTPGSNSSVPIEQYIRYIPVIGTPGGCEGDSGGPLLNTTGTNTIVGITSFKLGDSTNYARLANVRLWLANPQKLNVIANNEKGFLLNTNRRTCIGDFGGVPIIDVCDGRNQPTDVQYWQLVSTGACGGNTCYQIKNTSTGKCMSSTTGTDKISYTTCSTATAQRFRFSSVNSGKQIKIVHQDSGMCLQGPPTGSSGPFKATCVGAFDQIWVFHP